MASARIATIVTAFWPDVNDLNPSVTRRTGAGRRSVILGLHPHDLLERLYGLVPDRHGQLQPEGRLGSGHRVLRRIGQRAVGHLNGQAVGVGLRRLDALEPLGEHAGEVGVRAAGGGDARAGRDRVDAGYAADRADRRGHRNQPFPRLMAAVYESRARSTTARFAW